MQLYVPSLNEIREQIPLFKQGTLVQGFCRKKNQCCRFYSESLLIQPTTWGRLLEAWFNSANLWLRGIKMYRFPWYLTLVSTNHASSNPGQTVSSFYRSSQASFSWYSLFYQSSAFLLEVISKTVSY